MTDALKAHSRRTETTTIDSSKRLRCSEWWVVIRQSQWRIQDFPEGGRQSLRRYQTTIWPIFLENCMKMKKFWSRHGRASLTSSQIRQWQQLHLSFRDLPDTEKCHNTMVFYVGNVLLTVCVGVSLTDSDLHKLNQVLLACVVVNISVAKLVFFFFF